MSSITSLTGSTPVTTAGAAAIINNNFTALNNEKVETSYLDTDTSLTANSDTKIATQKAVKAYVDSGGQQNASETVRGLVEEATDAEVTAGTATGGTGAKLFVTPAKLATRVSAFTYLSTIKVGAATKDISNTTTTTIAHGLGKAPVLVKLTMSMVGNSTDVQHVTAWYAASTVNWQKWGIQSGSGTTETSGNGTGAFRFQKDLATADNWNDGTLSADATNISITWSLINSPAGTVNIIWEAYA